jgi:hypothetical protein
MGARHAAGWGADDMVMNQIALKAEMAKNGMTAMRWWEEYS